MEHKWVVRQSTGAGCMGPRNTRTAARVLARGVCLRCVVADGSPTALVVEAGADGAVLCGDERDVLNRNVLCRSRCGCLAAIYGTIVGLHFQRSLAARKSDLARLLDAGLWGNGCGTDIDL